MLIRYQQKCDELEVKNGEFRQQFDQLEENKKDIVAFIKKKLDEKGKLTSLVNSHLNGNENRPHFHWLSVTEFEQLCKMNETSDLACSFYVNYGVHFCQITQSDFVFLLQAVWGMMASVISFTSGYCNMILGYMCIQC